ARSSGLRYFGCDKGHVLAALDLWPRSKPEIPSFAVRECIQVNLVALKTGHPGPDSHVGDGIVIDEIVAALEPRVQRFIE
ncbi:hypothetical protein, partial [Rhizobium leguminosarum]|uniref:hypothetical protein n=1 Tax=Rhizobium leguminosarum TaxID=384 RepID=UPI003F9BAB46